MSRPVLDLTDRVVLVSGGTQGVGAEVARCAVRAGAHVVITGRRAEAGEATAAELTSLARTGAGEAGSVETGSGEVVFVQADVGDLEQARGCVARTVERFGRIDGLVNAAGLTSRGSLLETTPELFDAHVAVNLRAPFFLMQAAVADMVGRGEPGSIVNVISISAHGGQPYLAPYVAAKAGLVGLTRNAAHAHRWDRVRVNGVNIGWTETEGEAVTQRRFHDAGDDWADLAAANLPMGRLARPADAASLVVLLLSEASGVVTGSIIDWDQTVVGGYD